MAWDTPSVNRAQRAAASPAAYAQRAARVSIGQVLWSMACAAAIGVLFGWVASAVMTAVHGGAAGVHRDSDRAIEAAVGVLAAAIFFWRAGRSGGSRGLPRWVRDRADRRSFGGWRGDSGYGDIRYGNGYYAASPEEVVVVAAVEVVADILADL